MLNIQQQNANLVPYNNNILYKSSLRNSETIDLRYSPDELERMKHCGLLFDRKATINKDLIDEFFRKEPSLYNQITFKYAARIFHCLKADLNENIILKTLKQQNNKDQESNDSDQKQVAEVPKINYKNSQEKKNTLKLAFSVLRFQRLLEQLLDECQFYAKYPESKDEQSLTCTILFDYMMRKFQKRDLTEDEILDRDQLVDTIENSVFHEKTHLAAALARNRIKSDALTVEELLPIELREVEQHKAELPLYCWINVLKTDVEPLIQDLIDIEGLTLVDSKGQFDKKCFMIDPHCHNVLKFHYTLRDKIMNHSYVKEFKLVVQDKSSCLAPHTVRKLLYKKDDIILTNVYGGLTAAYLGCMMRELEGRVYAYGATTDEKYEEVTQKLQQIGCSKYVKVIKEDFQNIRFDEPKLANAKVVLINAPCSKSALMNPIEFLFQEGEDLRILRDFSVDLNNQTRIRKAVQVETAILKHAMRFAHVRAIVYQTYSKHNAENDEVVVKTMQEFNQSRRSSVFPYKLAPPVIPISVEDIQNDEIAKGVKYLQFKPSNKMNGCFIALLARDKDAKVDKEARKLELLNEKKAREAAIAAAAAEEAAEKRTARNNLEDKPDTDSFENDLNKPLKAAAAHKKKSSTTSTHRKPSQTSYRKRSINKKSSHHVSEPHLNVPTLEEQIMALERREADGGYNKLKAPPSTQTMPLSSLEDKLAQIGKLKPELKNLPARSSTPDEDKVNQLQKVQLKEYQLKLNK